MQPLAVPGLKPGMAHIFFDEFYFFSALFMFTEVQ